MRCSSLLAVLLTLAGCNDKYCSRHSDCPAGDRCTTLGVCSNSIQEDAGPIEPTGDGGLDAAGDALDASDAAADAANDGG